MHQRVFLPQDLGTYRVVEMALSCASVNDLGSTPALRTSERTVLGWSHPCSDATSGRNVAE